MPRPNLSPCDLALPSAPWPCGYRGDSMMLSCSHAKGPLLALLVVTAALFASVSGESLPIQVYGTIDVDTDGNFFDIAADGAQPYYWVFTATGLFRVRLEIVVFLEAVNFLCPNPHCTLWQVQVGSTLTSTQIDIPTADVSATSGQLSRMPSTNFLFICATTGLSILDVTTSSPTPHVIWAPDANSVLSSCSVCSQEYQFPRRLNFAPSALPPHLY